MIQIGDDRLYTSSVFDQMQPPVYPKRVTWVAIYTAIFDNIAYCCLCDEITVEFNNVTKKFLDEAERDIKGRVGGRSRQDITEYLKGQNLYDQTVLVRCIHPLARRGFKFRHKKLHQPYSTKVDQKNDRMRTICPVSQADLKGTVELEQGI